MRFYILVFCVATLRCVSAQGLAPNSVVNMIVEQNPTSGFLTPAISTLLTGTGISYNIHTTGTGAGLLVAGSAYTWSKTGPNTGTLEYGNGPVKAQTLVNFGFTLGTTLGGTYQDRSGAGTIRFTPFPVASSPPLRNISNRATLTAGQTTTAGFVVAGSAPRQVLVRAVGPSLGQFGIANPATDPVLTVFAGNTQVGQNSAWGGAATLTAVFTSVGAFALPAGSHDCALVLTLAPGNYTAQARSASGGEVLMEVYFVE